MNIDKRSIDAIKRIVEKALESLELDDSYEVATGPQIGTVYKANSKGRVMNKENTARRHRYNIAVRKKNSRTNYPLVINMIEETSTKIRPIQDIIVTSTISLVKQAACEISETSLIHLVAEDCTNESYLLDLFKTRIKSTIINGNPIIDDLAQSFSSEQLAHNNLIDDVYKLDISKILKADHDIIDIIKLNISDEYTEKHQSQYQKLVNDLIVDMVTETWDELMYYASSNRGCIGYNELSNLLQSYIQAKISNGSIDQQATSLVVKSKTIHSIQRDLTKSILKVIKDYADSIGQSYQEDVTHLNLDTRSYENCIKFI